MRPLPQLTPATEWFWTSGADGRLRIQGCTDCGKLVHPPVPICPACRSRAWEPTALSGRGTVVGFTVNRHQWLPGFEPPYVIANVALAEDPSVHLTTNIVGCDPDDVHIGQEVAVRFEQHEDVWLPLFEPTGATTTDDRVGEPRASGAAAAGSAPIGSSTAPCSRASVARRSAGASWSIRSRSPSTRASRRSPTPGSTLDDIDGLSTYPGGCSAWA